jgi:hypothetical protein
MFQRNLIPPSTVNNLDKLIFCSVIRKVGVIRPSEKRRQGDQSLKIIGRALSKPVRNWNKKGALRGLYIDRLSNV